MDHVAVMNKSWRLIPKILSVEKTIESRWYLTKRAPWGKIWKGDRIFFKNSGEAVTAQASVSRVWQFEIKVMAEAMKIIQDHGREICLVRPDPRTWGRLPRYCILVGLKNPRKIKVPFQIDKKGFGIGAAWLVVGDIARVRI